MIIVRERKYQQRKKAYHFKWLVYLDGRGDLEPSFYMVWLPWRQGWLFIALFPYGLITLKAGVIFCSPLSIWFDCLEGRGDLKPAFHIVWLPWRQGWFVALFPHGLITLKAVVICSPLSTWFDYLKGRGDLWFVYGS